MRILTRVGLSAAALIITLPVMAADSAGRPKIYGIAFVRVKATDIEKSKAFYGGVLGLQSGGPACKGVANPCFTVNPSQRIELVKTDTGDKGPFLPEIGLATNSVEQMAAYLTAKGIAVSQILRRPDSAKYLEVLDPEHHKIVFVDGTAAGESGGIRKGAVSNRLLHAGFVAKDSKAESRFYEDVLGFNVYWHGGFKDDETDWYMVQVPDGTDWLEYMLNISPEAEHRELGIQYHFSLGVVNVKETAKALEARGVRVDGPPLLGRDGKWQLTLYDPDDTRAEVMEFTPAEKPCCSAYGGTQPKP
jgi:catechol 2,3-dioxygenase-like lactoylglutathione lyase family enzyme